MTKSTRTTVLLASAVAGLLAMLQAAGAAEAEAEKVARYGIDKCKGTGDGSGAGHACGGQGHIGIDPEAVVGWFARWAALGLVADCWAMPSA